MLIWRQKERNIHHLCPKEVCRLSSPLANGPGQASLNGGGGVINVITIKAEASLQPEGVPCPKASWLSSTVHQSLAYLLYLQERKRYKLIRLQYRYQQPRWPPEKLLEIFDLHSLEERKKRWHDLSVQGNDGSRQSWQRSICIGYWNNKRTWRETEDNVLNRYWKIQSFV